MIGAALVAARPVLRAIFVVVVGNVLGHLMGGCASATSEPGAPDPNDPYEDPIAHCQGEARASYTLGGASVEDAIRAYDRCLEEYR